MLADTPRKYRDVLQEGAKSNYYEKSEHCVLM